MSDNQQDMAAFARQLASYKQAIDKDIATYAAHVRKVTKEQYGTHPAAVTNAYLDMLALGGKRIRGTLAIVGYKMCGGTDMQMITRAATALEMINTYILVIDDIQDRSTRRRGRPTVHEALAAYAKDLHVKGDIAHAGVALALNASLQGAHAAQVLLAGLSVPEDLRLKAIGIVNQTMITTAHGQTADIMNELLPETDLKEVEHALEWKTAHYTILNPLCVGMVLAGAGCEDTDAIRGYALNTGKTFQITDDIIGIFGTNEQTGKSVMDDIREGKKTILTTYALEHSTAEDRLVLEQALGNDDLTEETFVECQRILRDSGALEHAKRIANHHVTAALDALNQHKDRWSAEDVSFLSGLVQALPHRMT